ncbi:MAG: helix-turn-helix domain-containing protein [Methylobacter sp.]|jgi:DNA-binding transcriptional regulator YiaG|nr:helix-turn-helix domain-containing protein [Methylobacter sp.]
MYHYQESGLNNIWLVNGYDIINDPDYGECVSITDVSGLNKAIAHHFIFNKPSFSGAEFRFLRKELDLSQKALADLLGNDEQAIARWEKKGKVPKWADRLLRACLIEFYDEGTGILELIARIKDIDEIDQEKELFEDYATGWKRAA